MRSTLTDDAGQSVAKQNGPVRPQIPAEICFISFSENPSSRADLISTTKQTLRVITAHRPSTLRRTAPDLSVHRLCRTNRIFPADKFLCSGVASTNLRSFAK